MKGVYQGWKVGNGESLTLGVKDKGNNADVKECYIGFSRQGSESNGGAWVVYNGVITTNPLTQSKAYVSIFPANETTVKKLTDRFDIQCELGNVATPYQPYAEQSLTLTSDRPLTKWDRLVEQSGQIGWLYKSREVNFTGEESWKRHTETDMSVWFACYNCLHGIKTHNVTQNIGAFNNYALWSKEIVDDRVGKFCTNGNLSNNFFLAGMPKDYTVETFKAWLREKNEYGKPMRLTYETETTEFIPLPQSEQNAIRALKTYYPTTVITADGGELDPDIKVTYRKEI